MTVTSRQVKKARKLLPNFAKSLAPHAMSVNGLREAVREEIKLCKNGENPLDEYQVRALFKFLDESRELV